jgi:hypothetical protein
VESVQIQTTLQQLPIGARLLVRSKKDWRTAAVSAIREERIVLTVCSPTGRTYRLRRELDSEIIFEGTIPVLKHFDDECWRDNFSPYDHRW